MQTQLNTQMVLVTVETEPKLERRRKASSVPATIMKINLLWPKWAHRWNPIIPCPHNALTHSVSVFPVPFWFVSLPATLIGNFLMAIINRWKIFMVETRFLQLTNNIVKRNSTKGSQCITKDFFGVIFFVSENSLSVDRSQSHGPF